MSWTPTPALARAVLVGLGAAALGLALGRPDVVVVGVPLVLLALTALAPHAAGGRAAGRAPTAPADPGPAGSRPTGEPERPLATARAPRTADAGSDLAVTVDVDPGGRAAAAGAELVVVRLPGTGPDGGPDALATAVAVAVPAAVPDAQREAAAAVAREAAAVASEDATSAALRRLVTRLPVHRWGPTLVARPDALAVRADGMLVAGPLRARERSTLVLPVVEPAVAGPLPPRPLSVVGRHMTRRTGEGIEPAGVDPFRPGDRLRRIHWGVTARRHSTGADPDDLPLHVRRSTVDADGDVVLLLDTRLDVGSRVAEWSAPDASPAGTTSAGSSLDATVTTALALAAAHVTAGDRVSLVDLARPRHGVRPGAGRRHLARVRLALASVQVSSEAVAGAARAARAAQAAPAARSGSVGRAGAAPGLSVADHPAVLPRSLLARVPTRALVVLLSPFLDARAVDLAASLQRHGRSIIGVDTLPTVVEADPSSPHGQAAIQLLLAERAERLALLRLVGVAVLPAGAQLAEPLRRLVRARELSGGRSAR